MRQIIVQMVRYIEQEGETPLLNPAEEKWGNKDLRLLVIKIVGWLKSVARSPLGRHRPLSLDSQYSWRQPLLEFIVDTPELSELFEPDPTGRKLDFRDNIPLEERMEIQRYIDEHYRPPVRM